MVKVCQEQYPKGSYKGQNSDGYYMDGMLKQNIDMVADNIVKDMQFVALSCSSTLGVRTGKSTLMQQVGRYYTTRINEKNNLNIPFDIKNIVFRSQQLIDRALELPPYSCIILDEGDDLTSHSFSKTMTELKRFFRKCGQLNLFIILILPDYFELPKTFALGRSIFLLDVRFENKFERGYFRFFSFNQKKKLYIHGKRNFDYTVTKPSFIGRFPKLYTIDEEEYRKAKYEDLKEDRDTEDLVSKGDLKKIKMMIFKEVIERARKENLDMTIEGMGIAFGISKRTAYRWLSGEEEMTETKGIINNKLIGMEHLSEDRPVEWVDPE